VLHSGKAQFENVATVETIQPKTLLDP